MKVSKYSDIRSGLYLEHKEMFFFICYYPLNFCGYTKVDWPKFFFNSMCKEDSIKVTVQLTKTRGFSLSIGCQGVGISDYIKKKFSHLQVEYWLFRFKYFPYRK